MDGLKMLLRDKAIAYYPPLARALNSINAAIYLQELCHWGQYSKDEWVFRSMEKVEEDTALSIQMQRTARTHLRKLGIIEERHEGMPRRLYFRVNWQALGAALSTVAHNSTDCYQQQADLYMSKYMDKDSYTEETSSSVAPDPIKNPMTYYFELAQGEYDTTLYDEDRAKLGKNFKDCIRLDNPTKRELTLVFNKMIEARSERNYELMPRKALADVREPKNIRYLRDAQEQHRPKKRIVE